MKVAVWIVADREVLYDAVSDELVIRDIQVDGCRREERVDRVPMDRVLHAYIKGRAPKLTALGIPTASSVNKKRH